MARVLIIEDEPTLRSSMARGLARLSEVAVVDSATLEGALALIDQSPPDVILSDIDLPDRSGLELLGELGRRNLKIPVVFISAYLKAYGPQIPRHAGVEVREKPVSLEELRRIVLMKTGESRSEPDAAPFGVSDYLQLACLGQRSVIIEGQFGSLSGSVIVVEGTAWSARDSLGEGEEAFRRLVLKTGGTVECRAHRGDPGPRNLFGGWEEMLLEAAQLEDERQGRASGLVEPVPSLQAEAEAPPPPDRFDELWEEGVMALLAKDYVKAAQAFVKARELRPNDGRVIANLDRLKKMGHLPADEAPLGGTS